MLYENLFKHIPLAACLVKSDLSLVKINDAFEAGLGFSTGEYRSLSLADLVADNDSAQLIRKTLSDQFQLYHSIDFEIGVLGKICLNDNYLWKGQAMRADNDLYLLCGGFTIKTIARVESVNLVVPHGTNEDLSVDNFPLSRKNLLDLFQNAAIGVHCTSADGTCLWANKHYLDLLGYETHEYIGQKTSQFVQDDNPEYLADVNAKIRRGETVNNVRIRMKAKNGEIKHLIVDSGAYLKPDGSFSHTKTFVRDDIESWKEKIAQQEQVLRLQEIASEKDRFIRIVFHELRTPLNVMALSVASLANACASAEADTATSVADLKHQMNKCLGLVDDLSFVMMFDSDNVIHPQPQLRNFRKDLQDVFRLFGVQVDTDLSNGGKQPIVNGNLRVVIADEVPQEVLYDKSLLRVLFNLISNALKFNAVGGDFEVFVKFSDKDMPSKTHGGLLIVSVVNAVDSSVDVVQVNKCFQKYLRMLPSESNSEKKFGSIEELSNSLVATNGLGLGLYVAYNIVQSLGGLLECSSSDSRACFSFTLPVDLVASNPSLSSVPTSTYIKLEDLWAHVTNSEISSRHVSGLPQKVAEAKCCSPKRHSVVSDNNSFSFNKRGRILVVDDSPICRKVLIRALESNGFTTEFACDGQEAWDKMSLSPCVYKAVLMDLRMPIMDGLTATKLIKEMPHASKVPIFIVTAEMGENIRAAATSVKADYFLSKPVHVAELMNVLEDFIKH